MLKTTFIFQNFFNLKKNWNWVLFFLFRAIFGDRIQRFLRQKTFFQKYSFLELNILNLWNCTRKSIRTGQPKWLKKILEFKFSWNEKKAYSILILQINSAWRTELFVNEYRTWCNSSKNIVTFNRKLLGLENRKVYLNVSNPNVFLNSYI